MSEVLQQFDVVVVVECYNGVTSVGMSNIWPMVADKLKAAFDIGNLELEGIESFLDGKLVQYEPLTKISSSFNKVFIYSLANYAKRHNERKSTINDYIHMVKFEKRVVTETFISELL